MLVGEMIWLDQGCGGESWFDMGTWVARWLHEINFYKVFKRENEREIPHSYHPSLDLVLPHSSYLSLQLLLSLTLFLLSFLIGDSVGLYLY